MLRGAAAQSLFTPLLSQLLPALCCTLSSPKTISSYSSALTPHSGYTQEGSQFTRRWVYNYVLICNISIRKLPFITISAFFNTKRNAVAQS